MTVAELTAALAARGLPTTGRKAALVARLEGAEKAKKEEEEEETQPQLPPATPEEPLPLPTNSRRRRGRSASAASSDVLVPSALFPPTTNVAAVKAEVEIEVGAIRPGTAHLGAAPASARAAAREKKRAGESRAVEHVALHDAEELGEMVEGGEDGGVGGRGKRRRKVGAEGKGKGKAAGRREWAAEVAVPGSAGLIDEVLAAAAAGVKEE